METLSIFEKWPQFKLTPASTELLMALQGVVEATAGNGRRRHHRRATDRVILMIASQNYGSALYGLCHLLAAISASGKHIHELLITENTLSARFVATRFDETDLPDNVVLEEDCLVFYAKPGEAWFRFNFARSASLVCLLDLLIELLGYDIIDAHYQALAVKPTPDTIRVTANSMAKSLYEYLKDKLPSAAAQTRAETFIAYLQKTDNQTDKDTGYAEKIDDDLIWKFWDQHKLDEHLRLRLYQSCAQAWAQFRHALSLSKTETLSQFDREFWEYENQVSFDIYERNEKGVDLLAEADTQSLFEVLNAISADKLSHIKCLNNKEIAALNPFCQLGKESLFLIRSALRIAIFAPIQAQLVEQRRRQIDSQPFLASLDKLDKASFIQQGERLQTLGEVCYDLAVCAAARLCETGHPYGIIALKDVLPPGQIEAFEALTKQAASTHREPKNTDAIAAEVMQQINQILPTAFPELAAAMKANIKKYRRFGLNDKKHIEEADFDPWCTEILTIIPSLMKLNKFILSLSQDAAFLKDTEGLTSAMQTDKHLFSTAFMALYGESHEQQTA